MDHGGEVPVNGGFLCCGREKALQVFGALFDGGDGLLKCAVVCLAKESLGSAEEALGVFVIGLQGKGFGQGLFCLAVVAGVEKDFPVARVSSLMARASS